MGIKKITNSHLQNIATSGEDSYVEPGHFKPRSVSLHSKSSSTKSFPAFWLRTNWRESKMLHKAGGGGASKGTLACKLLNFKKPIHPQKGLLIGMAWYC